MNDIASSATAPRSDWVPGTLRSPIGDFVRYVLIVTAIVGTLDIVAAHLHIWAASGKFPPNVFRGIASAAVGRQRAVQGGADMVLLGLFFHFFISLSFTLLFFLGYPRVKALRKNIWVSGVVYTLFVWLVMNFIVLPLSALHAPLPNFTSKHTYIGVCVLAVVFAMPIALGAERLYKKGRRE